MSGVSGVGCVAKGCAFYSALTSNGARIIHEEMIVLNWVKFPASVSIWKSIDHLLAVHGHPDENGVLGSEVVWVDDVHEFEEHPQWFDSRIARHMDGEDTEPGADE